MSCRPEPVLGAYVDGGLPAAESRQLEAHLVGCQRCRRSVVALREEAALLSAALCGRLPRDAMQAVAAAPPRAFWAGLPLCLAAVLAATSALSFLVEARLPAGFDWLHPARLLGVNDMIWNLNLFELLRNEASGWLRLGVGLGALASMAGMGSFLAGALLRRVAGTAALALLLCAGAAAIAAPSWASPEFRLEGESGRLARDFHGVGHRHSGESEHIRVEPGERIEGALYAAGESVTVEGDVDGDVFAFADRIAISGVVSGNVFVLGEDIDLSGEVQGSVFSAGERVELNGTVQRSVHAAAQEVRIGESAKIGRDVSAAARLLRVDGAVARDLNAAVHELQISGELGRDLSAVGDEVSILAGARVGGSVSAVVDHEDALRIASGARVAGEVQSTLREETDESPFQRYTTWSFYRWNLVWLIGFFGLGMLLHALLPGLFNVSIRSGGEFGTSLLLGFAAFVAVPIAFFLFAVTWFGVPIALLGAAIFGSGWLLSNAVVALLIGRWLMQRFSVQQGEDLLGFGMVLLVGLLAWFVLRTLPGIGVPLRLVLVPVGMGLLIRHGYTHWRARRGLAGAASY